MRFSSIADELLEGVCPYCRGRKYLRGGYECPQCKSTGTDGTDDFQDKVPPKVTSSKQIILFRRAGYICVARVGIADKWRPLLMSNKHQTPHSVLVYEDGSWLADNDTNGKQIAVTYRSGDDATADLEKFLF